MKNSNKKIAYVISRIDSNGDNRVYIYPTAYWHYVCYDNFVNAKFYDKLSSAINEARYWQEETQRHIFKIIKDGRENTITNLDQMKGWKFEVIEINLNANMNKKFPYEVNVKFDI